MTSPIRSRTRVSRWPSASMSATRSAGPTFAGVMDIKCATLLCAIPLTLMENPAPGNSSADPTPPAGRSARTKAPAELGDQDMRIARDGTLFYRGTPINRPPLVKLFASVLRRERDGTYWLVAPAERGRVAVKDAPFLAVELNVQGEGHAQQLIFRTNLDEIVTAGPERPLRVETAEDGTPAPYILVRPGLE